VQLSYAKKYFNKDNNSVGEDMEKLRALYIAGEYVKWAKRIWNFSSLEAPQKVKRVKKK
jgi:hypothetical protein